ncbi:MAG: hypothetical protein ACE5HI_08970 [bacterium]
MIFIHLLSHQTLVSFYGLGSIPGDWFGHYRMSHEFLSHSVIEFPMRLPFYQLVQVYFLSIVKPTSDFAKDFYLGQLVQVVIAFSFFPIIYLLFKKLINRHISLVVLLLASLLPYILVQSIIPWPKLLASTFALLAFYYYLKSEPPIFINRNIWLVGIFCGLSILNHWLGAIYSFSLLVNYWLPNKRRNFSSSSIKMLLKILFIITLTLLPIYLWGTIEFGIRQTLKANLSLLLKPEYSLFQSVSARLLNLITTLFFPFSIVLGLFRELPRSGFSQIGLIGLAARGFSWHFGAILGNISLTLTIYLVIKIYRNLKMTINGWFAALRDLLSKKYQTFFGNDLTVGSFIFGGIFLMILLQPVPITAGVSLAGLLPSAVLIFGFTLNYYLKSTKSINLIWILFVECMLLIWFWQGFLFYLEQNYAVNFLTSDPAILQLNEVIQYGRDFKLKFLSNFIGNQKILIVFFAVAAEFGILSLTLRQISKCQTVDK